MQCWLNSFGMVGHQWIMLMKCIHVAKADGDVIDQLIILDDPSSYAKDFLKENFRNFLLTTNRIL